MASPDISSAIQDGSSAQTTETQPEAVPIPSTPKGSIRSGINGTVGGPRVEFNLPNTPPQKSPRKKEPAMTPRLKKKVPWKGKNIMILLPRDDERGQPGKAVMPLSEADANGMMKSWEQLGYDIRGFDLTDAAAYAGLSSYSMSRGPWPSFEDVERERAQRKYKVTLPDLNAWKSYVEELQEAKLRALGVSFGNEDPPAPSISPAMSNMSRKASVTHYPPLPFSPPIPTSSATSTQEIPGFPFQFVPGSSAAQSPGIPSASSPLCFVGGNQKFNPRQSISIPAGGFQLPQQPSPHGFSPAAMLHQGLVRGGSPSLANFNTLMSPTSPFSSDGYQPPMHQRHQSLQYPMMPFTPQHFQTSARASPRLQELREVDEEAPSKSPSKTPEPGPGPAIRHNASDSLQKEIDEAEYHLEEQFRYELENDKDYSPHDEIESAVEAEQSAASSHAREASVQFAPPPLQRFRDDGENGPVLHHPRPHSRGHSLANNYYAENEDTRDSTDEKSGPKSGKSSSLSDRKLGNVVEEQPTQTSASMPLQAMDLNKAPHERTLSTASNPWSESGSVSSKPGAIRRPSHGSKASLSGLNVAAPEFKFNPTSNFQPGQFSFGGTAFQPTVFQAGVNTPAAPPSVASSRLSAPTTFSSKINANAPVFSPGQSEFSFSAAGPKFRPDAPTFTPSLHSFSDSITSPIMSGSESIGNRGSSIFGNIDISIPDITKPTKKSKAIPIVRPASHNSPAAVEVEVDGDDRIKDDTRVKRAKASANDGDDMPLFAERTPTPPPVSAPKALSEQTIAAADTSVTEDQSAAEDHHGDTTMSSTMVSETDAKAATTTSPSEVSPKGAINWSPFEFKSNHDMADFSVARPFGEDVFTRGHKKSLSATAKPFVPGMFSGQAPAENSDEDAEGETIDELEQDAREPVADLAKEDVAISPVTPVEPAAVSARAQTPVLSAPKGLRASRYATSPTPPPVTKEATPEVETKIDEAKVEPEVAPVAQPKVEQLVQPTLKPKKSGLSASRYASSPPRPAADARVSSALANQESPLVHNDESHVEDTLIEDELPSQIEVEGAPAESDADHTAGREPTFEEIDDIMRHLNENDPAKGVNKSRDAPQWHQPSPTRPISLAAVAAASPLHLPPQISFGMDGSSPHDYYMPPADAHQPILSTELDDPFIDPPVDENAHQRNEESLPPSDWEGAFSEDEHLKLESRVNFFDGHVNDVVSDLLAARLGPVEKALGSIQLALNGISRRTPSSRRDRRSQSAEVQESDADDEDDEVPVPRRSMSPRRDKRLDQIRYAVMDAMATQQRNALGAPTAKDSTDAQSVATVLKAVEDMREQFSQSLHLDFRGEDLRNIVEEAVERRMPATPQPVATPDDNEHTEKHDALQTRILELEQRLRTEETKVEAEVSARRAAEDKAAEMQRQLNMAETKIEVEIMNRSAFDQRVADLEDRLKHQEDKTEEELGGRRAAEDRLSEIQRLLRISSEEENRLREEAVEREQKFKSLEENRGKSSMRLTLLETAHANSQKTQSDLQNRVNAMDSELREARQEARHWRAEAERTGDLSKQQGDDLAQTANENKHLKKLIDTLGLQLEENERTRESWREKFLSLQDDMSRAAREIAEETAQRSKREQELLMRQEVLDAKLQAEARTRERLESELERLEGGERQGMRAVAECKRLEGLLGELKTDNHKLQMASARYQTEFQEARESGAREVQRTRESMQAEIEEANHQVNVVREELEDQVSRLRSQLDQVKLDADTARARHEMLIEDADSSKKSAVEELVRKHQNEMEDLQERYERQMNNTVEDAQRSEQNLLERLSISTSKTEHLQERLADMEEKLTIAKEAAIAAAKAAKQPLASPVDVPTVDAAALQPAAHVQARAAGIRGMELPEKISPQALRESIMVLQEQLQEREQRIEELEQIVSKLDPDSETKISKRDDEIMWLRELLAVRHSDLQDIITALGRDDYNGVAVKDAAIRLKANLQMEEQERERAMNGGSAINLPNIAATIRDAATPRVAQAVGPLAAAWGNWRKSRDPNFGSFSSPAPARGHNSTPSRSSPASQSSFLSGLLTPPASGVRQTPPTRPGEMGSRQQQPTAFSNTGRRFTAEQLNNRPRGMSGTPRQADSKMTAVSRGTPPRSRAAVEQQQPVTPPMMRNSGYDSDAQTGDFEDASFFDD